MTSATPIDQGREWLSPTRAWRLTECPASVGPTTYATAKATTQDVNTGTLAHRVLKRWIAVEGYRAQDPRQTLSDAVNEHVAELGGRLPAGWALARARLLARGTALAALLGARSPDEVISEQEMMDPELRLRGTPDLVLLGPEVVLIDLKTQTFTKGDVPDSVKFQLTIYAYLVELTYGLRPDRVEVFSLNRGPIPVTVTDEGIKDALVQVASARASSRHDAKPAEVVCYFCRRRLECQPHWDAATKWPDADCVEGTLRRIEEATTGAVAVLIETKDGDVWVSGVPGELISGGPGDHARLVRLGRSRTNESGLTGRRWGHNSAVHIATPM
ncbi:PD-(D/E)XK nuclease family protein [Myceligenerans xiligouense]|uniref:PD-(D/E)XK nuclease family protein n=1 Tax=Myceligenerans xiligouense TaxID=253184 RepID=UPI000F4E4959|nr:PD-(D/E)XK nuclease family protein [Myceligenerans xiligouense]